MAHLPPSAAIFSPSVARVAASTAKDWNYIDSWLAAKFTTLGRSPPPFERNADTLKALLALATLNETADDQRDLLARVDAQALRDLQSHQPPPPDSADADPRQAILEAIESNLTREGTTALDALASTAVTLSTADPNPATLGARFISLQHSIHAAEQAASRVDTLARHIARECLRMDALIHELEGEEYRQPPELAKQNLDMQRRVKSAAAQLPEARERAERLAKRAVPRVEVGDVRREEEAYEALVARKRDLDGRIRAFEGLPPDPDEARREVDALRGELRALTRRRDEVFEGLVERETPRKGR